jgi:hypothetical protein
MLITFYVAKGGAIYWLNILVFDYGGVGALILFGAFCCDGVSVFVLSLLSTGFFGGFLLVQLNGCTCALSYL